MEALPGMQLLRRATVEHRRLMVWLGAAVAINLALYAGVVYPLSQRVANVAERERAAEQTLARARTEHDQASGTLTGKSRAAAELASFYGDILPPDLAGARRLTYLRLARLARESSLDYQRASYAPVVETDSTLDRLQIQLVLSGTYPEMRDFLYQLETAPEFVVVDNVQLTEGQQGGGTLVLTLDLSTYYRKRTP